MILESTLLNGKQRELLLARLSKMSDGQLDKLQKILEKETVFRDQLRNYLDREICNFNLQFFKELEVFLKGKKKQLQKSEESEDGAKAEQVLKDVDKLS